MSTNAQHNLLTLPRLQLRVYIIVGLVVNMTFCLSLTDTGPVYSSIMTWKRKCVSQSPASYISLDTQTACIGSVETFHASSLQMNPMRVGHFVWSSLHIYFSLTNWWKAWRKSAVCICKVITNLSVGTGRHLFNLDFVDRSESRSRYRYFSS